MRPELEQIRYIEAYLQGKLPTDQKIAFEKEMLSDPELKAQVEAQKSLMEGIKNVGLRQQITQAYAKFKLYKTLTIAGASLAIIVLVAGAVLLLKSTSAQEVKDAAYFDAESASIVFPDSLDGAKIENQFYTIQGDQDTVIVTNDGIVFAIEAGSFVSASGSIIDGPIKVQVKEAITPESIIKGGLETVTTSGEQLETGGMFYLNATYGGEILQVNPDKPIYSEIPTDEAQPGMQLYTGKYDATGKLAWEKPVELEKFLIPIDMSLLNFYPRDFEYTVEYLGLGTSKEVKDSLFYSFSSHFNKKALEQFCHIAPYDNVYKYSIKQGLDPAAVKGIWNTQFNNTLIATKEFESRMHLIYQTGNESVLKLYVNNLEKPIWQIDSMASEITFGRNSKEFEKLKGLKQGSVKSNPQLVRMLSGYYARQKLAAQRTYAVANKYWVNRRLEAEKMNEKSAEKFKQDSKLADQNFNKEFKDNLKSVYKQLGLKPIPVPNAVYRVFVRNTGWNNIDKQVFDLTFQRNSGKITLNGKTAEIKYEELNVQLNGS